MTARIAVACVCLVVGLAAIVGVASTAGPPDGYRVFADRDVRVYLPDSPEFSVRNAGQRDIFVESSDDQGNGVLVAGVPRRGRTLSAYERFELENARMAAPRMEDLRREDVDVPGADAARRMTFHDPDRQHDATIIIAQDDDRFVTLTIDTAKEAIDTQDVEDSFAITSS
jgi:hypothetical protein